MPEWRLLASRIVKALGTCWGALFASDRWEEAADLVERALEANGDDYNVYVPYGNAPAALGRTEATRTLIERALTVLEQQIEWVPEDTRARVLLAGRDAELGRRNEAIRELEKVQILALTTLKRAAEAGFSEWDLAARDPDLACLREEPKFKRILERGK